MSLQDGAMEAAESFGRLVIRRKWAQILPLFATNLQMQHSVESLQSEFGWKSLSVRLRQLHIDSTGEPEEMVPDLDPPKRFEVFEVEEREPPAGLDPSCQVRWVEVDFQPEEDSAFDVCYNCFLAFIDEGGPRIITYTIESATE